MAATEHPGKTPPGGFTLIEIMLVLAVLGILLSLAMPSYRDFLTRTHRTDALGQLMLIATCQERVRAATGRYDTAQCLPGTGAHYRYVYLATENQPDLYFQAAAVPLGAQTVDFCGRLSLDALGARAAGSGDTSRCWSGR